MAAKFLVALDALALRATACALSVFASQIHLSQRERQEHCRKLSHCTQHFSNGLYGLALPLRKDFPRPGEDVAAGDKRGSLARERLRGLVPRSAALSQKAALQMPFAVTTPSVKKVAQKRPQAFLSHKL